MLILLVFYDTVSILWRASPKKLFFPILSRSTDLCDSAKVTEFLTSKVSSITLIKEVGSELVYQLSSSLVEKAKYPQLFRDLDQQLEELHIRSYGVSDTKLEEVSSNNDRELWSVSLVFLLWDLYPWCSYFGNSFTSWTICSCISPRHRHTTYKFLSTKKWGIRSRNSWPSRPLASSGALIWSFLPCDVPSTNLSHRNWRPLVVYLIQGPTHLKHSTSPVTVSSVSLI